MQPVNPRIYLCNSSYVMPTNQLALRVASRHAAKSAQQIGEVAVDSGTVLVIDPAYLKHWGTGEHPDLSPEGYRNAWKAGRNQLCFANGIPAAVFIKGFSGDGRYPVFADIDPDGSPQVGSLTVDFEQLAYKVAARYRAMSR